jgi:hypothetical protein
VQITDAQIPANNRIFLKLSGRKTKNIVFENYDFDQIRAYLQIDKDVSDKAIVEK